MSTIYEERNRISGDALVDPIDKGGVEAKIFENYNKKVSFNSIKSFGKVNFDGHESFSPFLLWR